MKRMLVLLLVLVYMAMFINCHKTVAQDNSGGNELALILPLMSKTSESYLSSIQATEKQMFWIRDSQMKLHDLQITLNDTQTSQNATLREMKNDIRSIKNRLEVMNKRIIAIEIRLKQIQTQQSN